MSGAPKARKGKLSIVRPTNAVHLRVALDRAFPSRALRHNASRPSPGIRPRAVVEDGIRVALPMKRRIVIVVCLPEKPVRCDLRVLQVVQRTDCHRNPLVPGVRVALLDSGTREPQRRGHRERPFVEVERHVVHGLSDPCRRAVEARRTREQVRVEHLAMACAHLPEDLLNPRAMHTQLGVRREEAGVFEARGDREGRSGEQHVDAVVLPLEVERVAVPTTHVRVAGNGGARGRRGRERRRERRRGRTDIRRPSGVRPIAIR
mmetsp:Transcript_23426/g.56376  ORF Transcript_23426/g.56376 Transcript_23426/m.56376 type:complete len:262 (-) Transcript_23426:74-859(-)